MAIAFVVGLSAAMLLTSGLYQQAIEGHEPPGLDGAFTCSGWLFCLLVGLLSAMVARRLAKANDPPKA